MGEMESTFVEVKVCRTMLRFCLCFEAEGLVLLNKRTRDGSYRSKNVLWKGKNS